MDNPSRKKEFLDKLSEEISNLSEEESVALRSAVEILRNDKITSDQVVATIATISANRVQDQIKDEVKGQVLAELGLSEIDPTGVFLALDLIGAVAKGDVNGAANKLAIAILAKVAVGLLCVIC